MNTYTPKTWIATDKITDVDLNRIENRVEEINIQYAQYPQPLFLASEIENLTYSELKDIFLRFGVVYVCIQDDSDNIQTFTWCSDQYYCFGGNSSVNHHYYYIVANNSDLNSTLHIEIEEEIG